MSSVMADDGGEESFHRQRSSSPSNRPEDAPSPKGSSPHSSSEEGTSAWGRALRDVAPYLDLGWRLAGTTAGPPVLGLVVDLWLETTPWMLLAGCVFGLAGAVLLLKRLQGELRS